MVNQNNIPYNFSSILQDDGFKRLSSMFGVENIRAVGGAVRDSIYSHFHSSCDVSIANPEIDIATKLMPNEIMQSLKDAKIKCIPTGIEYGTVTAVINSKPYEITTLRKDSKCDGRHAKVEFEGDWQQDAMRRDFTINALYLDIDGNLYDYHDGTLDIQNKVVRFIGDPNFRIVEDYLRILRFYRFSASYALEIDDVANIACSRYANSIATLSSERITHEVVRLMSAKNPFNAIKSLCNSGVDEYTFYERLNVSYLNKYFLAESELEIDIDPYFRMAAVTNNPQYLIQKMRFANANKKFIASAISAYHELWRADFTEKNLKKIIRRQGRNIAQFSVIKSYLSGEISMEDAKNFTVISKEWEIPIFPITGKMLIEMGYDEGVHIGRTLAKLEDDWEDGDYKEITI